MHDKVLKKFAVAPGSGLAIAAGRPDLQVDTLKIDLKQEEVDKNINELIDRGLMEKDEDLEVYEYK